MTTSPSGISWNLAVSEQLEIKPTFEAMERHFYYGLRCTSLMVREDVPGSYRTTVELDGVSYSEFGRSAEESMGKTLLAVSDARAGRPS